MTKSNRIHITTGSTGPIGTTETSRYYPLLGSSTSVGWIDNERVVG